MWINNIQKIGDIPLEMGKVFAMTVFRDKLICACENGVYTITLEGI